MRSFEMFVRVPCGRFGRSLLRVLYHPASGWSYHAPPDPCEVEVLDATSESGVVFDLHNELDEETLESVYAAALELADECWHDAWAERFRANDDAESAPVE
jgi:hypothetical protein